MTVHTRARRGKHSKCRKKINKKRVAVAIIFIILIITTCYFYISNKFFKTKNLQTEEIISKQEQEVNTDIVEEEVPQKQVVDTSQIPEKMGNYEVLGQLVIEKIGLTKNVLNISENESLKLSIAKLFGPNMNESGNFCIDGHNWKNMLRDLSKMQEGDTLYMINRNTKLKVDYKIYKIYTCVPEDLSCLDQNNDGKKEITIITCTPGGAKRLICKAREI